ncbi:survival motor neuron protein [Nilaparvata lugens]|uniref:survival motor neuron protein n=1 Tax=Nilaparvata lugens TaxID=108931 RepID=UPI00193C9152|nr:survival motor neuron protein [Nilaparvata lugens]
MNIQMSEELMEIWDDSSIDKTFDEAMSKAKEKIMMKLKYAGSEKVHSKNINKISWKEGDYCRAVYCDGVEYEAEILDISRNQCIIKYFGYGNQQTVDVKELLVSHGSKAREDQCRISANIDEQFNNIDNFKKTEHFEMRLPGIPPTVPQHVLKETSFDESESLSAMLMSWYMSGYHAGYYQGLMASKNKGNN